MPILANQLNTPFTPTKTAFTVSMGEGTAYLEARGSDTAAWSKVGLLHDHVVVANPVHQTQYRVMSPVPVTFEANE